MSDAANNGRPPGPEAGMEKAGPPPRRRRWLGVALVVSICVNLLVIGVAAGFAWRVAGGAGAVDLPAGFDGETMWRVARALPDEDRDAARDVVHEQMPRIRELRQRKIAARRDIAARLTETPFDPEALRAALAEARAREKEGRDIIDAAFVRFVERLAPETRADIADALRRPPHRGWRHDHDD